MRVLKARFTANAEALWKALRGHVDHSGSAGELLSETARDLSQAEGFIDSGRVTDSILARVQGSEAARFAPLLDAQAYIFAFVQETRAAIGRAYYAAGGL